MSQPPDELIVSSRRHVRPFKYASPVPILQGARVVEIRRRSVTSPDLATVGLQTTKEQTTRGNGQSLVALEGDEALETDSLDKARQGDLGNQETAWSSLPRLRPPKSPEKSRPIPLSSVRAAGSPYSALEQCERRPWEPSPRLTKSIRPHAGHTPTHKVMDANQHPFAKHSRRRSEEEKLFDVGPGPGLARGSTGSEANVEAASNFKTPRPELKGNQLAWRESGPELRPMSQSRNGDASLTSDQPSSCNPAPHYESPSQVVRHAQHRSTRETQTDIASAVICQMTADVDLNAEYADSPEEEVQACIVHHRDTTSSLCHDSTATTKWVASMVALSITADGSNKPSGCQPTFRVPKSHPKPPSSDRERPPKTTSKESVIQKLQAEGPTVGGRSQTNRFLQSRLQALPETLRLRLPGTSTCSDARNTQARQGDQAVQKDDPDHPILLPDCTEDVPTSPRYYTSSEVDSDEGACDTPMTSPSASPVKNKIPRRRVPRRGIERCQLDGGGSSSDHVQPDDPKTHDDSSSPASAVIRNEVELQHGEQRSTRRHLVEAGEDRRNAIDEPCESQSDDETPLITPSLAKGAKGFPFPDPQTEQHLLPSPSQMRHPSKLFGRGNKVTTPTQRRLMASGARAPDRFIAHRESTPNKETLLLSKPKSKTTGFLGATRTWQSPSDPFGSAPRRSFRMAEQYATIRHPAPSPGTTVPRSSLVHEAPGSSIRATSSGSVWTVGGMAVTEGVASVANGIGGRVTSGTNAPHYTANFLRRNTPTDEEIAHGRRLALAMEIDQGARMVDVTSPMSSASSSSTKNTPNRVWRDGAWQKDDLPTTRMCLPD